MLSSRLKNLNPYVPGEQPKDRDYIKINANENPYPPSPFVKKAIIDFVNNDFAKTALYPDPDSLALHAKIADMLNKTGGVLSNSVVTTDSQSITCVTPSEKDKIPFTVTPDMIYTGNGSDEVLSFVFYGFFDSKDKLVAPEHSYSFYPVYCGFYDIERFTVSLNPDWTIDNKLLAKYATEFNSPVIFANPNAPTAIAMSRNQIKELLDSCPKNKIVVVDEAYVDFGGESAVPLLQDYDNLVIVRTFSKSLCAAGYRCGYLVSNKNLINAITTVKNSFNHFPLDAITQVACSAACDDISYYVNCAKKVCATRKRFIEFLVNKGFDVTDSKTNFVFVKKDGLDGKAAYEKIKQNGILVRRFDTPGIEQYLRITIGTDEQMDKLMSIMSDL